MKKKKKKEVFLRAAELVRNGWCQGHEALDEDGYSVPTFDSSPVKFCLTGAIQRASGEIIYGAMPGEDEQWNNRCFAPYIRHVEKILHARGVRMDDQFQGGITSFWNDQKERKREEVVALLDDAAQSVECQNPE